MHNLQTRILYVVQNFLQKGMKKRSPERQQSWCSFPQLSGGPARQHAIEEGEGSELKVPSHLMRLKKRRLPMVPKLFFPMPPAKVNRSEGTPFAMCRFELSPVPRKTSNCLLEDAWLWFGVVKSLSRKWCQIVYQLCQLKLIASAKSVPKTTQKSVLFWANWPEKTFSLFILLGTLDMV